MLSQLHAAGISFPHSRCLWIEQVLDEDIGEEDKLFWLNVAFEAPISLLQNLLWCALTVDFGSIRPRPRCDVYLFSLEDRVMVFPYDDRGMDVVGPNHTLLAKLYQKHNQYLLDYDRHNMAGNFERAS
jgi:hypothetical protein